MKGEGEIHQLLNGETVRGKQNMSRRETLNYYHDNTGVGQFLKEMGSSLTTLLLLVWESAPWEATVRWGRTHYLDRWKDCRNRAKHRAFYLYFRRGSQRSRHRSWNWWCGKSIEKSKSQFAAIVLDAFISSSIPTIYYRSLRTYFRAAEVNGIVFVHISNRHIDFESVLANYVTTHHKLGFVFRNQRIDLMTLLPGSLWWIQIIPSWLVSWKMGPRSHVDTSWNGPIKDPISCLLCFESLVTARV